MSVSFHNALKKVTMPLPESSEKTFPDEKLKPRSITRDSLPPCEVCGCAASGHHYGAVSCEACKSFFRRSFATCPSYRCISKDEHGACEIDKEARCPSCRLQKCRDVGMSKDAIHLGRYNHAQRVKSIVQMKYHKQRSGSPRCQSSNTKSLYNCERVVDQAHSNDSIPETPSSTNGQSNLIKAIADANVKHNVLYHILKDERGISERQLQYYNECLLKDKICGPVEAPSWHEFENFYNITGLEMDKRVNLASVLIKQMETLVKSAIKFAKAIPGFRELTLSDQASLIKGGFFEFGNVSGYKASNPELKITILVDGTMIGDNDMFWPGERAYVNRLMDFFKRLQNLRINTEEDALLQAIVLFSPGRADLEQAERVEKLHWDIVWSFWTLLHQNHQDASIKFTKIIDCLVELRDLTELDLKYVRNLPFDFSETVSSELVCELVNLPR